MGQVVGVNSAEKLSRSDIQLEFWDFFVNIVDVDLAFIVLGIAIVIKLSVFQRERIAMFLWPSQMRIIYK